MHEIDRPPPITAPTPASYRPATASAAGNSVTSGVTASSTGTASTAATSASAATTATGAAKTAAAKTDAGKSEGHHLWAHENFSFSDVLDAINPLQHLPIISMIYRSITGDNIGNVARVIGDGIYGGAIGAAFGMVDAVMVEETGKDVGGNLIAMVTGDEKEGKAASGTGKATQDPAPVVNPGGDDRDAAGTAATDAAPLVSTHSGSGRAGGGHFEGRGLAREEAPRTSTLSGHVAEAHAELTRGSTAPTAASTTQTPASSPQNINDLYERALAARNANSSGPAVADPNKPVDLPFFPGMNGNVPSAAPASQSSNMPPNTTSPSAAPAAVATSGHTSAPTSAGIPIDIAAAQSGLPSAMARPAVASGHGMNALPGGTGHGYAIDTSPNGLLAMRAATHTTQAIPLQMPAGSGLASAPPMPPASMDDFAQRMKQGMDKYNALMAQKKLGTGGAAAGSQLNQSY